MIKGIVFDLDGVITDTASFHYSAWKKLASEIGIEIDLSVNEQLKGISRTQSIMKILAYAGKTEAYSDREIKKLAERKNAYYTEMIQEITPYHILPGISRLIGEIREKNLKIALASASKNAPDILKRLHLLEVFKVIVDPETLKNGKPEPEIFERAARLLNLPPQECVGIEDARAGVQAIVSSGMFAVGVGDSTQLKEANLVFPNTKSIRLNTILSMASSWQTR
jgi:beta-phosphoglucomutase